jgi:hypothetical protein
MIHIGIDQSLTNTGVVIIDTQINKIIFQKCFSAEKIENFYIDEETYESREIFRIEDLIDEIMLNIKPFIKKGSIVFIESPIMGSQNSFNVIAQLIYLFYSFIREFEFMEIKYIKIPVHTHNKLFFGDSNYAMKKGPKYELFWKKVFNKTKYEDQLGIFVDEKGELKIDLCDAFMLAYTGSGYVKTPIINRIDDPLFNTYLNLYCSNVKMAKLCFRCPFYKMQSETILKSGKIKSKPMCKDLKHRLKIKRKMDQPVFEESQETPIHYF